MEGAADELPMPAQEWTMALLSSTDLEEVEDAADEFPLPNPEWKMALLSSIHVGEGSGRCGGRFSNASPGVEGGTPLL